MRRWPLMAVASLLLIATPRVAASPADPTCAEFSALAAADGMRSAVASPGYLVVERADSAVPAAQAAVNSLGISTSYAGYPYPGDTALSGLALTPVGSSAYPATVISSFPTSPTAEKSAGPISLKAASERLSSSASAQGAGAANDPLATGVTRATSSGGCGTDGIVTADADNEADSLSFGGGVLRVGRISSVAKAVVTADGQQSSESHLSIEGMSVGGQAVELTDQGLSALGTSTPLLGNPLEKALADQGITLRYLTATPAADGSGSVAPGVEVKVTKQLVGTGPTELTYTFGRAFASARATADQPAATPVIQPPEDHATEPATPASPTVKVSPPVSPTRAAPTPASPTAPRRASSTARAPVAAIADLAVSSSIYLVIVAAAAAVVAGAILLRTRGVRFTWN